jgi:hypothetical protein
VAQQSVDGEVSWKLVVNDGGLDGIQNVMMWMTHARERVHVKLGRPRVMIEYCVVHHLFFLLSGNGSNNTFHTASLLPFCQHALL